MSWWTLFQQSKTHVFRADFTSQAKVDRQQLDADLAALLIIAVVAVPIIIAIGLMIMLT